MPGPADGQHDGDPELELSSEDDARIQDLLAGLRHAEPTPDDVTARLDAALAGLREEPVAAAATRHWGRRLVLAAAGVAAVALVATPFLRQGTDRGSDSSTVAGAAADSAVPKAEAPRPLTATPSSSPPAASGAGALVELRSSSFGSDVEQQYDVLTRTAARDTGEAPCAAPTPSDPLLLSRTVLVDGAPARLDVTAGPAGSSRAVAYSCDGGGVVSRARIVAPTDGNSHGPAPQE